MTLADRLEEKANRLVTSPYTQMPDTVAVMREAAAALRQRDEAGWRLSDLRPQFDSYGQFDGSYR